MLEEVRFLLNFRMDSQSPMALILVGQNELWDKLQLQSYSAIRQCIDLRCKLHHFDRTQTGEYMKKHLEYAGAGHDIFSDNAVDEIFKYPAVQQGLLTTLVPAVCYMEHKMAEGLSMTTW